MALGRMMRKLRLRKCRPFLHQFAALLDQVRPRVGAPNFVADEVRHGDVRKDVILAGVLTPRLECGAHAVRSRVRPNGLRRVKQRVVAGQLAENFLRSACRVHRAGRAPPATAAAETRAALYGGPCLCGSGRPKTTCHCRPGFGPTSLSRPRRAVPRSRFGTATRGRCRCLGVRGKAPAVRPRDRRVVVVDLFDGPLEAAHRVTVKPGRVVTGAPALRLGEQNRSASHPRLS